MAAVGLAGWTGPSGRAVAHLRAVRQLARRAAARLAPSALTISGLGCIDVGVFTANTVAGWIVTGISLIVLEFRVDE